MPAAELFTCWAVPEAVAQTLGQRPRAVVAVGDCDPAAKAINSAGSGVPQLASLVDSMRVATQQWLAVHIPRE